MSSSQRIALLANLAQTAGYNGDAASLLPKAGRFIAQAKTANHTALQEVDMKLQHSPDGTNWHDLVQLPRLLVAGVSMASIPNNENVFPNVRGVVVLSTAGAVDCYLDLFFDPTADR